jgi:hypothetical protein
MASTPWHGRFDKVRIAYSAATASELVGYDVEIADVGWRGEELVGFLREGLSDGPAKMRLACRLVRERVDNAERRRAEPNREPWSRAGFCSTSGSADGRNSSTAPSLPDLASSRTSNAFVAMVDLPLLWWITGSAANLAAAAEWPLRFSVTTVPTGWSRSVVPTAKTILRGIDLRRRWPRASRGSVHRACAQSLNTNRNAALSAWTDSRHFWSRLSGCRHSPQLPPRHASARRDRMAAADRRTTDGRSDSRR